MDASCLKLSPWSECSFAQPQRDVCGLHCILDSLEQLVRPIGQFHLLAERRYETCKRPSNVIHAATVEAPIHGVGFVVPEDVTGRLPLAMPPALAADPRGILRDARYRIAVGRLERVRWYRSLWAFELDGRIEECSRLCCLRMPLNTRHRLKTGGISTRLVGKGVNGRQSSAPSITA